ncbi:hypothetical protein [Bradyrhizobium pachyrhizi]|uniref:hypothetical protein n=1 Tax=Bradyrhizobium pachyrhizi TaxID=280333 RepID=UPI00067D5E86|nr:hypothetical protein [Bradyrhizobium pachyrhizi]
MSPAATRRYAVGFKSWTVYEVVVFATSMREAIAKGKALYDLNGLADFSVRDASEEPWHAQCMGLEVRS